ncbi:MAG: HD domain-containing protein, partial [Planctomycetota bacterium]
MPERDEARDESPDHTRLLKQCATLSQHAARIEQLVQENEKLAGEVLQNYEQLSLLCDFTSKIAAVTRPEEVERLLIARLGRVLRADTVEIVSANDDWRTFDFRGAEVVESSAPAASDSGDLVALAEAATSVRCVGARQVLVAALPRLEQRVDVVLVSRSTEAAEFTSGDMRLVESLLTFGGQLINNTHLHVRLRRVSMETTRALVDTIDKKDRYTSGHSERVGFLARFVGEHLGLARETLEQLEWAGLLHDVGKIGVP